MTTTHTQALPQPTLRPIPRALAAAAVTFSVLIAVVALAMSLVALNHDTSAPAVPRVAASEVANVPVCPLHGRC